MTNHSNKTLYSISMCTNCKKEKYPIYTNTNIYNKKNCTIDIPLAGKLICLISFVKQTGTIIF